MFYKNINLEMQQPVVQVSVEGQSVISPAVLIQVVVSFEVNKIVRSGALIFGW